jgi:hypothetical protein
MIQNLVDIDVTYAVFYWILATLDDLLLNKKILLDAYNIHYYVILMHDVGAKLLEDIPYDASLYFSAMNVESTRAIELELSLLLTVLDYTTPYKLLRSCRIDKGLIMIIADVTGDSIDDITSYDLADKNNNNKFYNGAY